jgi:hypothetical protein
VGLRGEDGSEFQTATSADFAGRGTAVHQVHKEEPAGSRRSRELFGLKLVPKAIRLMVRGQVGAISGAAKRVEEKMDSIIYLVGLIVVVMAILSFFGLH